MADHGLKPSPIQMQLVTSAAGVKVPYTKFGVSLLSSVYLKFKLENETHFYGIAVLGGLGQGSTFFGSVATDWMKLKHNENRQNRIPRLEGLLANLSVSGALVVGSFGTVDVNLTVYDETNESLMSISRVDTPAQGILVADIKVRGKLVRLQPKRITLPPQHIDVSGVDETSERQRITLPPQYVGP